MERWPTDLVRKAEACRVLHSKIQEFKLEKALEIGWLLIHFKEQGKPFESVEDLLVDLLDDVIDVWVDANQKNDSCFEEEKLAKEWLEDELKNMEEGNFSF